MTKKKIARYLKIEHEIPKSCTEDNSGDNNYYESNTYCHLQFTTDINETNQVGFQSYINITDNV